LYNPPNTFNSLPLTVEEVMQCFRVRWNVSYDMKLLVRDKILYLQIMWGYLEQQSFPMQEDEYKNHLNAILEIINRIGKSQLVREFLMTTPQKPRLGRAITLKINADERLEEFVLGID